MNGATLRLSLAVWTMLACAPAPAAAGDQGQSKAGAQARRRPGLRFEVSYPASANAGPVTGRVFAMIARRGQPGPRLQIGRTGVPFFGRDIEALPAGKPAVIDATVLGSPVESLNDPPPGDYFVQELIPEAEKRVRVIREPYARVLSGGSTGGWEALALQIFNPDFFGGTWSYCPDSVTFTDLNPAR